MKTGVAIACATIVAAGGLGAAFLYSPTAAEGSGSAVNDLRVEVQSLQKRLGDQEGLNGTLVKRIQLSQAEAAQALGLAHENQTKLEEADLRYQELLAFLSTDRDELASVAGTTASSGSAPSASSPGLASPVVALAADGTPTLATPEAQAAVRTALEQIRKQEDEEREVQRQERRQQRNQERLDQMSERLNLQPFQREQIEQIWVASRAQINEMRQAMRDGTGDPMSMREQFMAVREEQNRKVVELLDPVQQEEYTKMQTEQRETGGRFGGGGRGGRGGF